MSLSQKLPESVFIFGCGYVGTALAEYLIEQGVRVGALTRNREKAARLRELGVAEVIEAELDSSTWHAQVRGQYEAVVNCVSSAGGGLDGYRKSYVDGQCSILEWAKSQTIRRRAVVWHAEGARGHGNARGAGHNKPTAVWSVRWERGIPDHHLRQRGRRDDAVRV